MICKKQTQKIKRSILQDQDLGKYSRAVWRLASRGWHRVTRQEESLTGAGGGGGRWWSWGVVSNGRRRRWWGPSCDVTHTWRRWNRFRFLAGSRCVFTSLKVLTLKVLTRGSDAVSSKASPLGLERTVFSASSHPLPSVSIPVLLSPYLMRTSAWSD